MRIPATVAVLVMMLGSAACGDAAPVVHEFGGPTMGSTYTVKFVGEIAVAKVRSVVETELAAFDAAFSQWRDDSEISRVNAHASTEPMPVSARFAAVLQQALDMAAATEGAFDPTVKPLSDLYRAAKRDPQHHLDPAAMAAAELRVGYRRLELRDGMLKKARPDVGIDLDGIVAGACDDAVAEDLLAIGLSSFYLEITGEVLCRGEKAPGMPWRIGVVDPTADATGSDTPTRTVALRDRSLCTSGDYRNAFLVDGKLVHHVFDPRTGRNPDELVVSASVIAASAATADALGTALMVLGPGNTKRLWPGWARFGVTGALLLVPGEAGELATVEVEWPAEAP